MLFLLMYTISIIATTSANYCEWGYCAPSEYCCGDNQCCKDNKTTWIIIIGLLTLLVVLSVCCAFLYRHMEYYLRRSLWRSSSAQESLITTKSSTKA